MKTPFRPLLVGSVVASFSLATAHLPAQITLTSLGTPVTENFDSLGVASIATLPANWRMTAAGDPSVGWADAANLTLTSAQASSGSPTAGGRYNWGQSTSERAIGFMTSGGYASPNSVLAHFSNNTGSLIDQMTISFDYERYRLNSSAASVSFFYSTNGTAWTAAASGDSGAFSTGSNTYGFSSLVSSTSKSVTLTSLGLSSGADFYLRWNFITNGSNSQGIGLDNFSLSASAVPEPSTYAAIAGGATLLGAAWQRRRQRRAALRTDIPTTPAP